MTKKDNSVTKRIVISISEKDLEGLIDLIRNEGSEVDSEDISWTVKNYLYSKAGFSRPLNKKELNKKLAKERYWLTKNKDL